MRRDEKSMIKVKRGDEIYKSMKRVKRKIRIAYEKRMKWYEMRIEYDKSQEMRQEEYGKKWRWSMRRDKKAWDEIEYEYEKWWERKNEIRWNENRV